MATIVPRADFSLRGGCPTGFLSTREAIMSIQAINPATGEVVSTHDEMIPEVAAGIVDSAHAAFADWRRASYAMA